VGGRWAAQGSQTSGPFGWFGHGWAEIGQRLNDLDVHLMRLDGVVAAMEKNLGALQKRSNGELKPLLLLLFVLAGFAAGAALSVFAGA